MFNEKYGFGDFVKFKFDNEWLYGRIDCVATDEYLTSVWYDIKSGDTIYLGIDEEDIMPL